MKTKFSTLKSINDSGIIDGPWVSVANPNWIIQGDDLYDQTYKL